MYRSLIMELNLTSLNIKSYFTDAREFKKEGNILMYEKACKNIMFMRERINSIRATLREQQTKTKTLKKITEQNMRDFVESKPNYKYLGGINQDFGEDARRAGF